MIVRHKSKHLTKEGKDFTTNTSGKEVDYLNVFGSINIEEASFPDCDVHGVPRSLSVRIIQSN